jgi:hypothetical protein
VLPADWRERMVQIVRGAEPARAEWFTGGPVCTPEQQIGIYVRQYQLRLYDALLAEVPGLAHLIAGEPSGEPLLRRYLAAHPSRTWTLNRVADRLGDWLAREEAPRAWVEMAHLDRAVQAGFEAADGEAIDPAALATMPRLRLQPHVGLLRPTTSVHEVRSAALTGAAPPPLREGDFPLVIYREDLRMLHWPVPLGLWGILDGLRRGLAVPAALEEAFARGLVDPDTLAANLGGWFTDLARRRLVEIDAPAQGEPGRA